MLLLIMLFSNKNIHKNVLKQLTILQNCEHETLCVQSTHKMGKHAKGGSGGRHPEIHACELQCCHPCFMTTQISCHQGVLTVSRTCFDPEKQSTVFILQVFVGL